MTCKNCKHWTIDPPSSGTYLDGSPMNQEPGWGCCEIGSSGNGEADTKETKAYALDYEQYGAKLRTAPDFGCVQFEPKDTVGLACVNPLAPLFVREKE